MMHHFKAHLSVLPPAQQAIWKNLAQTPSLNLVLYGGTAIALRLGHRISVDFDFFTHNTIEKEDLIAKLPLVQESILLQEEPNTLSFLTPDHVKLSFFGNIKFGRLNNPDFTEDNTLLVASLDDLMATKLKVILQRIEWKDYKDIIAMLKAGVRLDKGLALARQFYGKNFQPHESLKALVYFKGGDLSKLSMDEKSYLVDAASQVIQLPTITVKHHTLV